MPGYVYRTPAARDSAWGGLGLGLILTDAFRGTAYGSSPRQSLYREPFALLQPFPSEIDG